MQAGKSLRSALKLFAPSVLLEIVAPDWKWGSTEIERLRSGAAQISYGQRDMFGPAVVRDGYCILRFDAPAERPPPPPAKLVSAL